ncbi:hypothetical protein [Bacillus massiliglaciei]|uniref:hypothetical protein n=1 Tax=Bacillus massiliglaciei TaxID=1816693 RepID=UPI000DA603FF|nr:hypothetical protein [Bacillus massiliglaciei]
MKKTSVILLIVISLAYIIFISFSFFAHAAPPAPDVSIGDKNIPTSQGSYCWEGFLSGECVDKVYASPMELGTEHKATEVSPHSRITIHFSKEPMKENFRVEQWSDEEDVKNIKIKDNMITVPDKSGIYVYHIIAHWKQGDSNYAFSVQVK